APMANKPTQAWLLRLWSLYPILVPFYFMGRTLNPGTQKFESGVPQIADYYFAGLIGLVFLSMPLRLPRRSLAVVVPLAGFVGYTALVNMAWAAGLENMSLLKNSL